MDRTVRLSPKNAVNSLSCYQPYVSMPTSQYWPAEKRSDKGKNFNLHVFISIFLLAICNFWELLICILYLFV